MLLSLLKSAKDTLDPALLATQLRSFRETCDAPSDLENEEVTREVHSLMVRLLERVERRTLEEGECRELEAVVQLTQFLPRALLGRFSDDVSSRRSDGDVVIEELGDEGGTYLEPLGARLLLAAVLFLEHPSAASLLTQLVESHDDCCVWFFLEDVRSVMLSKWKAFHLSQSENAALSATPPSFETRLVEARRVEGVLKVVKEETLRDRVVDRLLPCVLFVVDDFDPRVASVGARSLADVFTRATTDCVRNWSAVLQKTICDRLLSSQLELWTELLPVAMLLTERCGTQKSRFASRLAVLEIMLERLVTDAPPYELAMAFLDYAPGLVRGLGRGTVRCFSKLFLLMAQWMFSSAPGLPEKTLDLLMAVIEATPERIGSHQQIVSEILDAVEKNLSVGDGDGMREKLNAARICLSTVCSEGCLSQET